MDDPKISLIQSIVILFTLERVSIPQNNHHHLSSWRQTKRKTRQIKVEVSRYYRSRYRRSSGTSGPEFLLALNIFIDCPENYGNWGSGQTERHKDRGTQSLIRICSCKIIITYHLSSNYSCFSSNSSTPSVDGPTAGPPAFS